MSDDSTVRYDVDAGAARITLDSPENRNALSRRLVATVGDRLSAAAADDAVRVVVLSHTGGTFCSGADLRESAAEGGPGAGSVRLVALLRRMIELPKPIIGRVDGHVRAGGLGLVGACDVVVAGPSASFAFSEVRIGVVPAIISLTTLPLLQSRAASRFLLSGETFDAATAAAIGFVNSAVPDADAAVAELVGQFRRAAPQALADTKAILTRAALERFDEDAERLRAISASSFGSDDAREGVSAFLDKRPPRWAL